MKILIVFLFVLNVYHAFAKGPSNETRPLVKSLSMRVELTNASLLNKESLAFKSTNKKLTSRLLMHLLRKPMQKAIANRTNMEREQSNLLIAGIILLVISVTLLSIALFNPALDSTLFSIFIGVGVPLGCFAFLAFLGLITYSDYN